MQWASSSSSRIVCRNGSQRRRAISKPKVWTTVPTVQSTDGRNHIARQDRRLSHHRRAEMDELRLPLTVNVAASSGHAKLYADVYSVSPSGIFVPGFTREDARRSCRRSDFGGLQIRQPLLSLQAWNNISPPIRSICPSATGFCSGAWSLIVAKAAAAPSAVPINRRAARFPQSHRQHLHDRDHDQRRSRSRGRAQIFPRLEKAQRYRSSPRALHPLLQTRIPSTLTT